MAQRAVLSPFHQPPSSPAAPVHTLRHRQLRVAALSATAATFVLIAIGALVRATGSGLGCPGWPKCFGRWVPPLSYHAVIEYSHRLATALDTVLVVALAAVALLRYRRSPRVLWPGVAAALLIVLQAALGALVVKGDLKALLVTAHFLNAVVLAGTLVYASVAAFTIDAAVRPVDGTAWLARVAGGSTLALLAVGEYVRGEGAGLAFPDWPLMDGKVVPALSSVRPALHFAHRSLAAAVLILVGWLAVRAWRGRRTRPAVAVLATTAAVFFVGQVLIGAANVWTHLSPPAVTAHVAVAALIWGALVATAAVASVGERE